MAAFEEETMTRNQPVAEARLDKGDFNSLPAVTIDLDDAVGGINESLVEANTTSVDAQPSVVQPVQSVKSGPAAGPDRVVHLLVRDLQPHPTALNLPKMSVEEWRPFAGDVQAHGVLEPIVVQGGGLVLDGRHRLEAAQKAGHETIPARVVNLSKDEQDAWVYRTALLRRHLTDDQRAILAALWAKAESKNVKSQRAQRAGKAGGRGRAKKEDSSGENVTSELSPGENAQADPARQRLRERAAELYQVSEHKLRIALELVKHPTKLSTAVLNKKLTLNKAHRKVREATTPKALPALSKQANREVRETPTLDELAHPAPPLEQTLLAEMPQPPEPARLTSETPRPEIEGVVSRPKAHPSRPPRSASGAFPVTAQGLVDALLSHLNPSDALCLLRGAVTLLESTTEGGN
jgi:ParB-like chromosome segregation protein Spo0J